MFERFGKKYPGDGLEAEAVNLLMQLAEQLGMTVIPTGTGTHSHGGRTQGFPPFRQLTAVIVGSEEDDDEDSSSSSSPSSSSSDSSSSSSGGAFHFAPRSKNVARGVPLYYDHTSEKWDWSENHGRIEIDGGGVGVSLDRGDVVVVFWDPQRKAWIPLRGGGSAPIIRFEIVSGDCSVCTATATVLSRPVGMSTVTGEVGGRVTLYDFTRCYLDAPEEDLIGRKGYAVYLTLGQFPGDCAPDPNITKGWLIISLCCVEDAC